MARSMNLTQATRYSATGAVVKFQVSADECIEMEFTAGEIAIFGKDNFVDIFTICHCVFSWMFAVLAAWFAGRMYDRRVKA
jgi:hypothetical protein